MIRLTSKQDSSVNFVLPSESGMFESRFVDRPNSGHSIIYLSSMSGCARACRMCHLTATQQVRAVPATMEDYLEQARPVVAHLKSLGESESKPLIHYNFMARGEALDNPILQGSAQVLFEKLAGLVAPTPSKFLISSIFPKTAPLELARFKGAHLPTFYYSLYSVGHDRAKWIPQGRAPREVLRALTEWQQSTGAEVKVHFAFIKGFNDSPESVAAITSAVKESGLLARFNIVRYNPPDHTSEEPEEAKIASLVDLLREDFDVKVVPRVGFDVQASCGMFVGALE